MVAQVQLGSFFLFRTWQTKCMYVTSLNLSCGTSDLWMKVILFVPCMPLLSPCANQLNSFAAEIFQAALNLGWHRSAWYSSRSPVSWSRTGWAASHRRLATCSAILSSGIFSWQHALTRLVMLSVADGCFVGLTGGGDSIINPSERRCGCLLRRYHPWSFGDGHPWF